MTITIGNGFITFSDGSGYAGTVSGAIATDTSLGTGTSSFNVGHLVFIQTIFPANGPGYNAFPGFFPLNSALGYYSTPGGAGYDSGTRYYNAVNANNTTNFGSQHYYSGYTGGTPANSLAGTWRNRGNARNRGINQGYLNGFVAERVA